MGAHLVMMRNSSASKRRKKNPFVCILESLKSSCISPVETLSHDGQMENLCGGRRGSEHSANLSISKIPESYLYAMGFYCYFLTLFLGSYRRYSRSYAHSPCYVYYPSCKGLSDGRNVYQHRNWSTYYAECKDQRLVGTGQCPTNQTLGVVEVSEKNRF